MKKTVVQRPHRRRRSSTLCEQRKLDDGQLSAHHPTETRDSTRGVIRVKAESPMSPSLETQSSTAGFYSPVFDRPQGCYASAMTLIVDINHWLEEDGELPTTNLRLRRNALRIVRFVEYGGPLKKLEGRLTLVECKRRPKRQQCLGLMWVVKQDDDRIQAYCSVCHDVEAIISGWDETPYADGVMPALPMYFESDPGTGDSGGNGSH